METITRHPKRTSYTPGPGSLECLKLTTWTRRGIGWMRVRGTYSVYCGNDGEHTHHVDTTTWVSDYIGMEPDDAIQQLIDWELYDWSDPCEQYDADEALDVWLRFIDDGEEAEAEANTYRDGVASYRVDWSLTSVGLVKSRTFSSYDKATAWLESEGFTDYSS